MGIQLPTEKKKADTGFPDRATWLVFGAPKSGKSYFAASWPECLILDLENGTRYIEGAYVLPIKNLAELREAYAQLSALAQKGELPYKTIAIDTIDVVNEWIEAEVAESLGIRQIGEAPYGSDWAMARNKVLDLIRAFAQLPVNLLVISHSRWAIVNDIGVGHTIDLPGRLARFVMAYVDNIIYIHVDGSGERKLLFRPHQGIEAGCRHPVLANAGSCPASYEALVALFESSSEEGQGAEELSLLEGQDEDTPETEGEGRDDDS